jgi:hypothetical protein
MEVGWILEKRGELTKVSSRLSPWILQGTINGDALFEIHLEVLIGLRITLLKPFQFTIFFLDTLLKYKKLVGSRCQVSQ